MLKKCSQCESNQISDRTAQFYYLITAILAVVGTVMLFISWPWAFLIITAMIVSVILAVDLPNRTYRCKNCGHEWKEEYNAAGDFSRFSPENGMAGRVDPD